MIYQDSSQKPQLCQQHHYYALTQVKDSLV